jgi:hypothetical protein
MNYVTELLEEQKELLTEEMRFAEGKELEQTKQRMTDVVDALNKLSIHGVSGSLFETAKQLIEMYEERITRANRARNYLDAHNNQISVNVLEHLIAVINHNDR